METLVRVFRAARRHALPAAILALVFFQRVPEARAAAPFSVNLRYEVQGVAERCWDEAEFRRQVARSLGYDPFGARAAVSVDVQVGATGNWVHGQVEWRNAQGASLGERRFGGKDGDCTKLLTEMSFAVGLQIELLRPKPDQGAAPPDPDTTTANPGADRTPAEPAPKPAGPSRASPPSAEVPAPGSDPREAAVPSEATAVRMWIGAGPSLAWGLSPSLTAHGRVFFGVRRGDFSLELGADATLPVTDRQPDGSAFREHVIGGGLGLCGHRGVLGACLVAKVSQLRVTGQDVDQPETPTAALAQAGARLNATWEFSQVWSLTPRLDVLGLLTPRAVALNGTTVWDMPSLSLLVGIDVAARFR
ncbi:MAG TPA: hypothetical protein VGK73_04945 [Polyangiaceae bacterium]